MEKEAHKLVVVCTLKMVRRKILKWRDDHLFYVSVIMDQGSGTTKCTIAGRPLQITGAKEKAKWIALSLYQANKGLGWYAEDVSIIRKICAECV